MSEPRTILIVYNPKAGATDRRALLERLAERMAKSGFEPDFVTDLTEVTAAAHRLQRAGQLRLIVAAGGDGTVAAVAERVPPETCLGVFPLGTENLLAKWLGATQDPELLIAAIQNNQSIRIDAALANDKLSLITIGVGFDAEVVRRVHQGRAGHITKWSYAWPIWRAFWSYRFPELTVTAETGQTPAVSPSPPLAPQNEAASQPLTTIWKVRWLFVANLPKYAGGLSLSPSADPHDGRLDLAMFQRGGRVRGLLYAAWLALRRPLACRDFMAAQATEILVESTETVGFQVDGDFGGQLPLRIQLLPGRIRLLRF